MTRRDTVDVMTRGVPRDAIPGEAGDSTGARRLEELLSAEQILVGVRWAAVAFTVFLVATYGGPAPAWVAPVGFTLAGVLALGNAAATLAVRRIETMRGVVRLAWATLLADTLVVAGFVWLYTFDEGSVHFLLFFVLPAEAALKFQLAGALGMWTGIGVIYAARQAWATATYGFQLSVPSIVYRLGILLIVTVILGLFAQLLTRRTAELSETNDRLRREERWRTALIDMLAHDFRAPVGTAISSLEMIDHQLEAMSPDDIRRLLAAALRQSRRGLALADDLLTMARIRQDHLELLRQETDVAPLLQRIADGISDLDGSVRIDAPADLHATLDPARLEQVVTNLLSNARRYGRPPVVVRARPLGAAGLELNVSDAGDGVPATDRDSLFTPFAGGPRQDSVGLGLWLVDVLATAHGGRATYDHVEGRPTFTVTLPGPSATPTDDGD